MDIQAVKVTIPEGTTVIAGQTHFIKTVEDLYEVFKNSVPDIKFGIAFCEASQDRLVRWDGNDEDLTRAAIDGAKAVGAGHFPSMCFRPSRRAPRSAAFSVLQLTLWYSW